MHPANYVRSVEDLDQRIIIENQTGAAGDVAGAVGKRATPGGYTLFSVPFDRRVTPPLYRINLLTFTDER